MAEKFAKRFRRHLKKRKQSITSSIEDEDMRHDCNRQTSATSYQDSTCSLDYDKANIRNGLNETATKNGFSSPVANDGNIEVIDQFVTPATDHTSRTSTVEVLQQRVEEYERLLNQKDIFIQQQSDELQATRTALQAARQQSQKHKQRVFDVHQKFLRWHALIQRWIDQNKKNQSKKEWSKPPSFESVHLGVLKRNTVTPAKEKLLSKKPQKSHDVSLGLNERDEFSNSQRSVERNPISTTAKAAPETLLITTELQTRPMLGNKLNTTVDFAISEVRDSTNDLLDSSVTLEKSQFKTSLKNDQRHNYFTETTAARTKNSKTAKLGKEASTLNETENSRMAEKITTPSTSFMVKQASMEKESSKNETGGRRGRHLLLASDQPNMEPNHDIAGQENKHPNYNEHADSKRQKISQDQHSFLNGISQITTQGSQTQLYDRSASTSKSVILPSIPSRIAKTKFPKSIRDKVHHSYNDSQALIDNKIRQTKKQAGPSTEKETRQSFQSHLHSKIEPTQPVTKQSGEESRIEDKKSAVKAINGWRSNVTTRAFMDEALAQPSPKQDGLPFSIIQNELPAPPERTKESKTNRFPSTETKAPLSNNACSEGRASSSWLPKKIQKDSHFNQREANQSQPSQAAYKFVEVVRGKKKRQCLPGHSCPECDPFWSAVCDGNNIFDRKQFENCSRHRSVNEVQQTPPHFWDLSFRDEILQRSLREDNENGEEDLHE